MERQLNYDDARGALRHQPDSAATLARDFAQALSPTDVKLARRLVTEALELAHPPGRLYVDVVRPALHASGLEGTGIQQRLLTGLGRAIVADFVRLLPATDGGGAGRRALLTSGDSTIEQLDALIVTDFLEADGWVVQQLYGPQAALDLGPASRAGGIQLAVAIVAGPEQALRLAPACTEMQRLPDPPVCLLCDFTGRSDWPAASAALGADGFISDPQELLTQASGRLPAGETRRWGVSIARRRDALVLAPTGRLDGISAQRLAEVVESRMGTFKRLVIDLRDLAELSASGIEGVRSWDDSGPLRGTEVLLVGDGEVRRRVAALQLERPVVIAEATAI